MSSHNNKDHGSLCSILFCFVLNRILGLPIFQGIKKKKNQGGNFAKRRKSRRGGKPAGSGAREALAKKAGREVCRGPLEALSAEGEGNRFSLRLQCFSVAVAFSGAPGESLRLGWWYPWRLVQVVAPEIVEPRQKRKELGPLAVRPRSGFSPSWVLQVTILGGGGGRGWRGGRDKDSGLHSWRLGEKLGFGGQNHSLGK